MKKILIFFVLILLISTPVYALTREDIGSDIQIPNKDGKWDTYKNVYTFEELYSVLEDLSAKYLDLLEEYHSQERNYKEELAEKDKEIERLEYELSFKDDKRNNYFIEIIVGFIIIIAIIKIILDFREEKHS